MKFVKILKNRKISYLAIPCVAFAILVTLIYLKPLYGLDKSKTPAGADHAAAQTGASGLHDPSVGQDVHVGVVEVPTNSADLPGSSGFDMAKYHFPGRMPRDRYFIDTVPPLGALPPIAFGKSDHGTLVADVTLSNEAKYLGVASGALAYGAWINNRFSVMAALDIYQRIENVYIFNNSWGVGNNDNGNNQWAMFFDWFCTTNDAVCIKSAGNNSPPYGNKTAQISVPGDAFNIITVGAVDNTFQRRAPYSSYLLEGDGPHPAPPNPDNRGKPDIVAPGGLLPDGIENDAGGNPRYIEMDGTSFAAPHVAGVVAMLVENGLTLPGPAMRNHLAHKAIILNAARKRYIVPPKNEDAIAMDHSATSAQESDYDYLNGAVLRVGKSQNAGVPKTENWTPCIWDNTGGFFSTGRPLDDELGTGVLDAERTLIQHAAGEQEEGIVGPIGWSRDMLAPSFPPHCYQIREIIEKGTFITATLTWDRRIDEEDGDGIVEKDDNYLHHTAGIGFLPDFDLRIYKVYGGLVAQSIGSGNSLEGQNVEHLHIPVPETGYYEIRVNLLGTGSDWIDYGLAWWTLVTGPDYGDAPDPYKGIKGTYPTCKNDNGAWHEYTGVYEWLGDYKEILACDSCINERRVSFEDDADDPLDEDSIPNLGPENCCITLCETADHDKYDDGSNIGGRWYDDCIIDTVIIAVSTNGEKAQRYAFNNNADSLLYLNLFIDWTHNGLWTGAAICHQTGDIIPEHTVFLSCDIIGPKSGYGHGIMNNFPDNKIVLNPNKWHNSAQDDTLICRVYKVTFMTPDSLLYGPTWTRWRLDYGIEANTHLSTGGVDYGEVEDYPITQGYYFYEEIQYEGYGMEKGWTYRGVPITTVPWDYSYWTAEMDLPITETITGILNFRSLHPEFDNKDVHLKLYMPADPYEPASDWRQIITYDYGAADVTGVSMTGPPWDYAPLTDLPEIDWSLPVLASGPGQSSPDTIYMAVNLKVYYDSNPFCFLGGDWEVGQNLTALEIEVVDGIMNGVEGVYLATSEFVFDSESATGFTPSGGVSTLLNSSTYPTDIVIIEEKAGTVSPIVYDTTPIIGIEKTQQSFQGTYEYVSITLENGPLEMGGFDFLIAYDASALAFMEAEPGQLLEDCGWEYFTYRHGVQGNCGDACPSGLLRIIAIAETNDGPNHPSCFGPPDTDPHELAKMKFFVTDDRTYECQYVPIYFFWIDCGDNMVSSVSGNPVYVDRKIFTAFGDLIWDEEDDDEFPEDERIPFVGAPDFCINPDPEKPTAIRLIDFVHGGIDIVCADSIDLRCDLNLDEIPYTIADAVMYVNYFVYGPSAFIINYNGQIAASDCNNDGRVLTVADLVYLIRVITGDAMPFPKMAPEGGSATAGLLVNHSAAAVLVNSPVDLGAVQFVIEYSGYDLGEPHLINGASDMTLKYSDQDGVLKVLVYSMEKDMMISAGQENIFVIPLTGEGEMTIGEVQLSDYDGNVLNSTVEKETVLPTMFALHQNYPNPFNATTQIVYELPHPARIQIEIYNVRGQKVAVLFDGEESAGIHRVEWSGKDDYGNDVASGIYFYRLTTADYKSEKKMLLMK